jgi:hypothetical protein
MLEDLTMCIISLSIAFLLPVSVEELVCGNRFKFLDLGRHSFNQSAGELGLASNVVHLSWGGRTVVVICFLMTTPRGPWLGALVRTLALSKTA